MKRTPLLPSQWGVVRRKKDKAKKHVKTRTKASLMAECNRLWSKIVRARANHVCEWCESAAATEAHHQFGRKHPFRFEVRAGVGLCHNCHERYTSGKKAFGNLKFREGRRADYDYCQSLPRLSQLKTYQLEEILAGLREQLKGFEE